MFENDSQINRNLNLSNNNSVRGNAINAAMLFVGCSVLATWDAILCALSADKCFFLGSVWYDGKCFQENK